MRRRQIDTCLDNELKAAAEQLHRAALAIEHVREEHARIDVDPVDPLPELGDWEPPEDLPGPKTRFQQWLSGLRSLFRGPR